MISQLSFSTLSSLNLPTFFLVMDNELSAKRASINIPHANAIFQTILQWVVMKTDGHAINCSSSTNWQNRWEKGVFQSVILWIPVLCWDCKGNSKSFFCTYLFFIQMGQFVSLHILANNSWHDNCLVSFMALIDKKEITATTINRTSLWPRIWFMNHVHWDVAMTSHS